MRYLLLLNYPQPAEGEISDEAMAEAQEGFRVFAEALNEAGVFVSTDILQPSAVSHTVSRSSAGLVVGAGPLVESESRLGGVFVIDVADADAAIAWAKRCPAAAWGTIEVRPSAITWSAAEGWHPA